MLRIAVLGVRVDWGEIGGKERHYAVDSALRKQGYISAVAAAFSALSVFCQALAQL